MLKKVFLHINAALLVLTASLASFAYALEHTPEPKKSERLAITLGINLLTYSKNSRKLTGDVCVSIESLETVFIDRTIIELHLICMAFMEQGIELDITLIPFANYVRAIRATKTGDVDAVAGTIWTVDINSEELYSTIDVIRKGEFQKGIYVHEKHPLLKVPASDVDISKYTGITYKTWTQDMAILNAITPNILELSNAPSILKLLVAGRGDFSLMEFPQQNDMTIHNKKLRLLPVLGVKVVVPDSRQFIVSKKTENGEMIFNTLNKGLGILRARGEIHDLYEKDGFFHKETDDWIILNEHQLKQIFQSKH